MADPPAFAPGSMGVAPDPGTRMSNGDVAASALAQQVFQGNRQLWRSAYTWAEGTAAGLAVVGGAGFAGMALDTGAATMSIMRLPVPAAPGGLSQPALGQLLGFGRAGALFAPASYNVLSSSGITLNTLIEWMQFYGAEALVNPANPSAAGRAGQLSTLIQNWPF